MTKYRIKVKNPVFGVPITFLDQFNPNQFSIVAFRKGIDGKDLVYTVERESRMLLESTNCKIPKSSTFIAGFLCGKPETYINHLDKYYRILIQRKSSDCSS